MARPEARSHVRSRAPRRGPLGTVPGAAGSAALALDPLIHDRTRLGLLSALAVSGALSFVELRTLLNTSDGNLSVHARKLEDVGFVQCTKTFTAHRVPHHRRGTPSARIVPEAHGGADPRDPALSGRR